VHCVAQRSTREDIQPAAAFGVGLKKTGYEIHLSTLVYKEINMNRIASLAAIPLVIFVLEACSTAKATSPQTIATIPQITATVPEATKTLRATETMPSINSSVPFPFSEPGPYQSSTLYGTQFSDTQRAGREIGINVWYPVRDDKPDRSGAPYPLILSSSKVARIFGDHLASYGFVVVGVNYIDTYDPWDQNLIDQPLDILFALDQVAAHPPEGLEGMIDAERAGVMGYSFDGYNALAMSGARVDPQNYLDRCANPASVQPAVSERLIRMYCAFADDWDQFAAHAGEALTVSSDGLWQPMTDERIRAVMPMAPEGAWLFGERGLAAVDRPILIIGAVEDQDCPYATEAAFTFEHVNTPDRFLISFVGMQHIMIYFEEPVARMKHFSVAFFGYYLQGHPDYALYFSEDFVSQRENLVWGVFTK
jgi:predicted dienelactone hydrolase